MTITASTENYTYARVLMDDNEVFIRRDRRSGDVAICESIAPLRGESSYIYTPNNLPASAAALRLLVDESGNASGVTVKEYPNIIPNTLSEHLFVFDDMLFLISIPSPGMVQMGPISINASLEGMPKPIQNLINRYARNDMLDSIFRMEGKVYITSRDGNDLGRFIREVDVDNGTVSDDARYIAADGLQGLYEKTRPVFRALPSTENISSGNPYRVYGHNPYYQQPMAQQTPYGPVMNPYGPYGPNGHYGAHQSPYQQAPQGYHAPQNPHQRRDDN